MRFLLPLLLLTGTATALSSKEVLRQGGAAVLGPVKKVVLEQRYDAKSPDADFGGMNQTLEYDRQGRLVQVANAYYEGFRDIAFEYTGACVKRRTEQYGYGQVTSEINVYFPDKSCNDAQYSSYENGKMVSRTVIAKKGNTVTETSYRANNSIARTEERTCTADGSECRTQSKEERSTTAVMQRYDARGQLQYSLKRVDDKDGTFYESEESYNARGRLVADRWTYSTLRADDGSELFTPKVVTTRYTHRYTAADRYGNWSVRQDYRLVQTFGKTSEVLDGVTRRTFSYY